ncbi:hypothetical protein F4604DRAFT_664622 [Suillus subluteus]|nr:hypothetical protein F4604DRAFT_664622 [Suillus subluteus]
MTGPILSPRRVLNCSTGPAQEQWRSGGRLLLTRTSSFSTILQPTTNISERHPLYGPSSMDFMTDAKADHNGSIALYFSPPVLSPCLIILSLLHRLQRHEHTCPPPVPASCPLASSNQTFPCSLDTQLINYSLLRLVDDIHLSIHQCINPIPSLLMKPPKLESSHAH